MEWTGKEKQRRVSCMAVVGGGGGGGWGFFFFNDTATTEIYTLSLHDALPISRSNSVDRWMHLRSRLVNAIVARNTGTARSRRYAKQKSKMMNTMSRTTKIGRAHV